MSLKIECHSKWYVTQNGKSLKMEYPGTSLKIECHLKCNVF